MPRPHLVSYFFIDPRLDSDSVSPFWTPDINPYVLKCKASNAHPRDNMEGVLLPELTKERQIIRAGGQVHLQLRDRNHVLQFVFDEDIDLKEKIYFEALLSGPGVLSKQLEALTCLDHLVRYGRFTRACDRLPPKPDREVEAFMAFDLKAAGYSDKDVGRALFGARAVKEGWDGATDCVRSKTRRLKNKGRRLVRAGCRAYFG